MISAIGATLFGCRKFGVVLYFITVISSVIIGVGQNLLCRRNKDSRFVSSFVGGVPSKEERGIAAFSGAVSRAALSMLSVCAFVVFFSTFTGTLGKLVSYLRLDESFGALLFSFFELTSGAASAACVRPISVAILIAAFAVGWSGLSVHFQIVSICDGLGLSLGRYFFSKLIQGALNVLFLWMYLVLFGETLVFEVQSVSAFLDFSNTPSSLQFLLVPSFLLSLIIPIFLKNKKKL